jgi:hypothetical protein
MNTQSRCAYFLERETGFEPATSTLARWSELASARGAAIISASCPPYVVSRSPRRILRVGTRVGTRLAQVGTRGFGANLSGGGA